MHYEPVDPHMSVTIGFIVLAITLVSSVILSRRSPERKRRDQRNRMIDAIYDLKDTLGDTHRDRVAFWMLSEMSHRLLRDDACMTNMLQMTIMSNEVAEVGMNAEIVLAGMSEDDVKALWKSLVEQITAAAETHR